MINDSYYAFFGALAGVCATLVGLLFVAVSVAPAPVVGPKALGLHRIRSSTALEAFGSTLMLSLVALMPHLNVGWPATVAGTAGLGYTIGAARERHALTAATHRRRVMALLIGFLLAKLLVLSSGIRLLINPHDTNAISMIGFASVGLVTLGIDRSWELVGGRSQGVTTMLSQHILHPASPSADQ